MFSLIAKRSSRYIGVTGRASLMFVALAPSPSLIAFCEGKGKGEGTQIFNHLMEGRLDKAVNAIKEESLKTIGGAIKTGVPSQLSWGFLAGFASGEWEGVDEQ
jgi:hypothetical protein